MRQDFERGKYMERWRSERLGYSLYSVYAGRSGQSGLSLISVIVAAGLLGIISLGVMNISQFGFRAKKELSLSSDREALKRMLLLSVSCRDTLPAACTPGQPQALFKRSGTGTNGVVRSLIPASGRRYGNTLAVKAFCTPDGDGLDIRTARVRPGANLASLQNSDYLPNPLTKRVQTFDDPASSLFPVNVSLCGPADRLEQVVSGAFCDTDAPQRINLPDPRRYSCSLAALDDDMGYTASLMSQAKINAAVSDPKFNPYPYIYPRQATPVSTENPSNRECIYRQGLTPVRYICPSKGGSGYKCEVFYNGASNGWFVSAPLSCGWVYCSYRCTPLPLGEVLTTGTLQNFLGPTSSP